MEIKTRAYLYMITSLLIGSFTPVLLILTKGTNPFEFFFLASLASVPVGLALAAKNGKLNRVTALLKERKKLFYISLSALLAYVTYEYGIAYAEHFISASLTTVLFRLNPLLMLLFLPVILRERLSRRQFLALFLALAGVIIGVTGGNVSGLLVTPNIPIIALTILLALGYALSTVIIKWQKIDNDVYLSTSAIVLTIFFGALFFGTGAQLQPLSYTDLMIIAYIAITNIFSFYMYIYALKKLKTTVVTNTFMLSPFLTFLWAGALFSEQIKLYYLAIAALVGLGIFVQRNDALGGSYIPRKSGMDKRLMLFDVSGAFVDSNENNDVRRIIASGGRVVAAKIPHSDFHHISAITKELKFNNVYTGAEQALEKEVRFIRDILGLAANEVFVMKAGHDQENEDFFHELSRRITDDNITS